MKQLEQTITTLEIAEMADVSHRAILRKLEGREEKGKHIKGIIEVLTNAQMGVSDYFIESTYKDASGKENKCYNCTKKGCEFLAHKFQGKKVFYSLLGMLKDLQIWSRHSSSRLYRIATMIFLH